MKKYFTYLIAVSIIVIASCSPLQRTERKTFDGDEKLYSRYLNYPALESTDGIASFYSKRFNGKRTASGEIYNMNSLTASHKTYPFGTIARITNIKNDHSVIIKVNDRMPLRNKRAIDLSYRAAKELNMIRSGTAKVKIDVLKWGR